MKEFNQPNLKAPRFRPKVYNVLEKEFFDSFKKKFPRYSNLDNSVLKNIIKTYNKILFNTVIDTRDGIQLPESLGWLFIGTCQTSKKKNIDFNKSSKYGVIITNSNLGTDGKLAKIFYSNSANRHKIKNREFWGFTACREFKRAVAKSYSENWNMYLVLEPKLQIKAQYNKTVYKNILKTKTQYALKNYNEFDI